MFGTLAVYQFLLGVEALTSGAVQAAVTTEVNVTLRVHGAEDLLDDADVRGVGGAGEVIERNAIRLPGRAEGSDIALFGDSGVEKAHANIVLEGGRYYLEDLQTPGGSFINDQNQALWEPGEQTLLTAQQGGVGSTQLDPGLKDTRTFEIATWVEHELVPVLRRRVAALM